MVVTWSIVGCDVWEMISQVDQIACGISFEPSRKALSMLE